MTAGYTKKMCADFAQFGEATQPPIFGGVTHPDARAKGRLYHAAELTFGVQVVALRYRWDQDRQVWVARRFPRI